MSASLNTDYYYYYCAFLEGKTFITGIRADVKYLLEGRKNQHKLCFRLKVKI